MLNRIGPAIGRGDAKRVESFNAKAEVSDWKLGWILDQMMNRNISQGDLAKCMGTSRQSVSYQICHNTQTSSVFRYAAMYVLQHMYYDTESNEWVVID